MCLELGWWKYLTIYKYKDFNKPIIMSLLPVSLLIRFRFMDSIMNSFRPFFAIYSCTYFLEDFRILMFPQRLYLMSFYSFLIRSCTTVIFCFNVHLAFSSSVCKGTKYFNLRRWNRQQFYLLATNWKLLHLPVRNVSKKNHSNWYIWT